MPSKAIGARIGNGQVRGKKIHLICTKAGLMLFLMRQESTTVIAG